MSIITVKGYQVRKDELKPEIEVDFKSLSINGQTRIFMENKNLFLKEALESEYDQIRELPIKFIKEYSVKTVNEVMKELAYKDIYTWLASEKYEFMIAILNDESLKIEEKTIERLACSDFWGIKKAVAVRKDTGAKALKSIFFRAVKEYLDHGESELLDIVIVHPNFFVDTSLERAIIKSYSSDNVKKITEKINSVISKK